MYGDAYISILLLITASYKSSEFCQLVAPRSIFYQNLIRDLSEYTDPTIVHLPIVIIRYNFSDLILVSYRVSFYVSF